MADDNSLTDLSQAFTEALNIHGYGFQYGVAKKIEDLHTRDRCPWYLAVVEFPIVINGRASRIDLILKHKSSEFYIVAECKRANPAYSDWVFARSSFLPPVQEATTSFVEEVFRTPHGSYRTRLRHLAHSERAHHIGLEIKTDKKGDRYGAVKDQIEQAATQACLGMNGLVGLFASKSKYFGDSASIKILPVVFTTANLYSSPVKLSDADLATGQFEPSQIELVQSDWINLHYHQSPNIVHSIPNERSDTDLRTELYAEYVRTIPIISPEGIASFLLSAIFGY